MILIQFKHGEVITNMSHQTENGATLEVIVPYNGTNVSTKKFYTTGRAFWSNMIDSGYSSYKEITKETHPEYFL